MEYKYVISNEHHLVEIDDKTFVIDTGSPKSFSFRNKISININSTKIDLNTNILYENKVDEIETLVGLHLDGLIGLDLLRRFNTIIFNKDTMKISFDEQVNKRDNSFSFKYNCDYIDINVVVDNKIVRGILDTGAANNYLNGVSNADRLFHDYSPIYGMIDVPFGNKQVLIGKEYYELDFGDMSKNEKLKQVSLQYPINIILGINYLFEHRLEINFTEQFINID